MQDFEEDFMWLFHDSGMTLESFQHAPDMAGNFSNDFRRMGTGESHSWAFLELRCDLEIWNILTFFLKFRVFD